MVMITVLKILTDCLAYWIFASFFREFFAVPVSSAVLLAPALAYILWILRGGYFGADYDRQLEKFRKLRLLFLLLPFFMLLRIGDGTGTAGRLLRMTVSLLIIYCLLQMLLFRILRQDPAIRNERRFRIWNLSLMGGIALLAAALSSSRVLYGISRLLLMIWKGPVLFLAGGILRVFAWTLGWILYLAVLIILRLFSPGDLPGIQENGMPGMEDPAMMAETIQRNMPPWLPAVAAAGITLLLFWLERKLFLMLADRTGRIGAGNARYETRSFIPSVPKRTVRERMAEYFSPAGRIRRSFRQFIQTLEIGPEDGKMTGRIRRPLPPGLLSEDILALGMVRFPEQEAEVRDLTAVYRRARYEDRSAPVTAEDASHAEELERKLK